MTYRAGRIIRDPEAFSRLRPRQPRRQSGEHLKFIRSLPCVVCSSRRNIQAAHLRSINLIYGKRESGIGAKPNDAYSLPLCSEHHEQQHKGNELTFWASHNVDPFKTAAALFACSGDDEAGELVVKMAKGAVMPAQS